MLSFNTEVLFTTGIAFLVLSNLILLVIAGKASKQLNYKLVSIATEIKKSNQYLFSLINDTEQVEEAVYETKLYVGNIDYSVSEGDLADHFAKYGKVDMVNIPTDKYTGKARGFGFVTFQVAKDARRAMSLDGSEFKGRQIQVNFARERAS